MEQTIWRAATYTPEDLEAATEGLPDMLRVPLSKLLQRSKAARYQTAGELETDLRRWLGGQFGQSEAAAELKRLKTQAGEALVALGLRRPRRLGQGADPTTTA